MVSQIRRTLLLLSAVAIITLAAVSAFRLSPDALALIIGLILGMIALLPLLILLLWWMDRSHRSQLEPPSSQNRPPPPVVIVQAPAATPIHDGRQMTLAPNQEIDPRALTQAGHVLQSPPRTWDYRVYGSHDQESVDSNPASWAE